MDECSTKGCSEPKVNATFCVDHSRKRREYVRLSQARLRDEVYSVYGGECICCGEREPRFLTLDHIDGGGTRHRQEVGWGSKFYRWLKREGFPPIVQVLCFNCNNGRHLNGGVCPHQEHVGG